MILCCGEALIDMLPRETAGGEFCFAPYSGGSVFNTAIALGRLGAPVSFFSGLSTDLFGDQLAADLTRSNVAIDLAHRSDRPTTLAFVRLVDGHATYTFFDENSAGSTLSEANLPDLPDDATALHFGAISLIREPCGTTYETLMGRACGTRVVSLDPNIRPSLIADRDRHLARMERMIAMADIVKLSDEDLAWFGIPGAPDDAAARWLARGTSLVVVTHGAAGASAWFSGGRVDVPGVPVAVADTIGAGDTFNAGILAALDRAGRLAKHEIARLTGADIGAALAFATRAAAVTVSRPGADPPWSHEAEPA